MKDYDFDLFYKAPDDDESQKSSVDKSNTAEFDAVSQEKDLDTEFDLESFRREYNKQKQSKNRKNKKASLADIPARFLDWFKGLKDRKKGSDKKKRTTIGKIILSAFLVCVITGCLLVSAFAIYVFGFVDDTVQEDLDELVLNFTTVLYVQDEQGEWVEYQRLHGQDNCIWVSFEKIPENLKNAYIAVEDKRFRSHIGVDWKRTIAAFANMFLDFFPSNQGGSTITQQLVKNLTGDNKQDAMRKIREIMRARRLEQEYSKDTILECYLNKIALGNGICGVEVAANFYFDKSTEELTLAECAALACMAKEPEYYRPDKHPENNKKRRDIVLDLMLEQGYITQEEHDQAVAEEITIVATRENINEMEINSYFVDALISEVVDDLAEQYNFDRAYASNNFYNGGYKIYCTLNPKVQNAMEEVFTNPSYFNIKDSKGNNVETAMTIMDYEGHIVGMIGGQGEKDVNRGLNRAWSSPQQPGSTMKPLAAYSPALEYNMITYSSLQKDDTEFKIDDKKWPVNWYDSYGGDYTIQKAIERSVNTIPVNLVAQLTLRKSFDFVTNSFGITTLVDSRDEDLTLSSLGLGGSSKGITTTESAAAYAVFGNLGKYYEPTTYLKITNQYGSETILQHNASAKIAMSEDTANIMNHLLQTVVYGSQGTGKEAAAFSDTFKAYAKTGTSSEDYDCWFVGGTPYYVGSCWYGYDYPAKVQRKHGAMYLWRDTMKRIHADLEAKEFPESEYVSKRKYCTETGLVATENCTSTAIGWYKTSYMPTCTKHRGSISEEVADKNTSSGTSSSGETSSSTQSGASSNVSDSVSSNVSSVTTSQQNVTSAVTQ